RENIYLNGSILGLSRAEIRRRLDDIIVFAELERFIDVPVKHYSSGMFVRLGFSVAAHTDPEILLIDEVLAVGDAAFQRKCIDRIIAMRNSGTAILFVTHSMEAVQMLCDRVLWLNNGRLMADDVAAVVIPRYLHYISSGEDNEGDCC
ncbi:MAG: ABC transporter ATP-binding protein, partial [Thermoproteota archaeon]